MYEGWTNLIGPVVFSGIITLAVWIVPQLRKHGTEVLNGQGKITIEAESVHQGGSEVWFHR
jgi:hypothetical protein